MSTSLSRRALVLGGSAVIVPRFARAQDDLTAEISSIEATFGGRLGVAMLDTGSGRRIAHRGQERFPLCSTFKVLAASLVLRRVERGDDSLARRVPVRRSDLVTYSPETERHVGKDMTMADLCVAALTLSDNTAANLLLASFGGPPALTDFARSLGDPVTRLDRTETSLNEALPGDPRDTTSPEAMVANLQTLLLGNALQPQSRAQLRIWMQANRTGDKRLRAGLPGNWRIGDKTGSGDHGTANDIAIAEPPGGKPILIAAYYTQSQGSDAARNEVIARIGALAAHL
jgi:beta-lactamase class A